MTTAHAQRIAHGPLVIGASEMGVVLGLNPYKRPIQLWREKRGELPPFEGNEETEWGHDVEPAVRNWYVRNSAQAVFIPPESMFHAAHPWCRATPDGLALIDPNEDPEYPMNWSHGFEAKKCHWRLHHLWGDPGTDEVPSWYLVQCQQGMAVAGLSVWHLAVTIGGQPPVVYVIRRDDDLIEAMFEAGADFVRRVETGEPPDLDGSEAWKEYLGARYPFCSEDYVQATQEIEVVAETLRETQALHKQAEEDIALLKNQLLAFAGQRAGVQTSIGKISCKPRKGRPDDGAVIKALAERYGVQQAEVDDLRDSLRVKDSRPVVAYWKKEKRA